MVDSDPEPQPKGKSGRRRQPASGFRRWCGLAIRSALILVSVVGLLMWMVYSSAQKEPDYYQTALKSDAQAQVEQGDAFEQHVLDLQNKARTKSKWQVTFEDAQINGWLANDFLKKFPRALPSQIKDPRVAIGADVFRVAFRFQSRRVKGIVQAEIDAFCTEVPGQLAIRIRKVHSGWVPIPVNSIADKVTLALRRLGLEVEWTEIENDPVALIQIPPEKLVIANKRVEIEAIELRENELVLAGTSTPIQE